MTTSELATTSKEISVTTCRYTVCLEAAETQLTPEAMLSLFVGSGSNVPFTAMNFVCITDIHEMSSVRQLATH